MTIKLIDVRYNLEYVGFQEGMDVFIDEEKQEQLDEIDKESIMIEISNEGCPYDVNYTLKKYEAEECKSSCVECWKREV